MFSNANIPSNWHSALNNTLNIFLKRLKRNIFLGVLSSDQLINDYFKMVSMNLNYIPHNISTKIINGKDGIIDLMIKDLTILQKLNNKINNYDNKTEINYFECSILCFLKLNYDKFNNFGTFDLEKINILKFISKGLIEFTDKTYENTNKLIQKYYFKCASVGKNVYILTSGQFTLPIEIVIDMITPYLGNPMQHYRAEKTNNSKAI